MYVSATHKVLKIKNNVIDTFCASDTVYYDAISVSDNGQLAVLDGYNSRVILYYPDGHIRSSGSFFGDASSLLYKDTEILVPIIMPQKDKFMGYIGQFKEYGFDKGLIILDPQSFLPYVYTFINYYPDVSENGGEITYTAVYDMFNGEGEKVPLHSLLGMHYIPSVYVEMSGYWRNSPVFRKLDFEVRELNKDSVVYSKAHNISPMPGEHIHFTDTLSDTLSAGEYAIWGELYTNNEQTVNADINYFTVIRNNVSLIMRTDTNDVPSGYTFHPIIMVINPQDEEIRGLHLVAGTDDSVYLDTIFDIDSGSVDTFYVSIRPKEPTIFKGKLILPSGDTLRDEVSLNVLTGGVTLNVSAPEYVNFEPFEVKTAIHNYADISREVVIKRRINADSIIDTLVLSPYEGKWLYDTFSTIKSDTLYVSLFGLSDTLVKKLPINLGIHCKLLFDTLYVLSPDSVRMTAVLRNNGVYDVNAKALFCLYDSSKSTKAIHPDMPFEKFVKELVRAHIDTSLSYFMLQADGTDTIPIVFNRHSPGHYILRGFVYTDSSSILLDSAASRVSVIPNSLVSIDTITVSPYADSLSHVPISVIVKNSSYKGFEGDMVLSSNICYFDTAVYLAPQKWDTIVFYLQDTVYEGEYLFEAEAREGGIKVAEKIAKLLFKPTYVFSGLANNYSLGVGDSGILSFYVRNIGNAQGERTILANWADVINLNAYTTIPPSHIDTFKQAFYIPDDMPGGRYLCNVSLLKGMYPEMDTFFTLLINGANIKAKDTLDRWAYDMGDTAHLAILIDNQNTYSGILNAHVQYGMYSKDTSFVLGGMEKGITHASDTMYFDTSGIYMFDPINTDGKDSISFHWHVSSNLFKLSFRTDSVIGKGNWIIADTGINYYVSKWTQIKIENLSQHTEWVDSFSYILNHSDTVVFDTFGYQRERLTFNLPVSNKVEKAAWGIYYPSGRSIVLDERYIYLRDDSLTVITDRGRYNTEDTVHVSVYKTFPNAGYNFHYYMYFSPYSIIEDSFAINEDTMTFSFEIPRWTTSGTYYLYYWVTNNKERTYPIAFGLKEKERKNLFYMDAKSMVRETKEHIAGVKDITTFQPPEEAIISGYHPFDVSGVSIYFRKAIMDTNQYKNGDTAHVWVDVSSNIDLASTLIASSTGDNKDTFSLTLAKDMPNYYRFDYLISGCNRGRNALHLSIKKDSINLAEKVVYFDVNIPDTTAPRISIIEQPSNTYSTYGPYVVKALIWDPDSYKTPLYDTLYYRVSSGGGYWQYLLPHSAKKDTYTFYIPSQPDGSLIQFHIVAQDSFKNRTRSPKEGEEEFWVLRPLRPQWDSIGYTHDTTTLLTWSPPMDIIHYHCGITGDTVFLGDTIVATRFIPEYVPAKLNRFYVKLVKNTSTKDYNDTVFVHIYEVKATLPGREIASFPFTIDTSGWKEFALPDMPMPQEGLFVGISGPFNIGVLFDGFGKGTCTAIYKDNTWALNTPGEALAQSYVSYIPEQQKSPSHILSFNIYRSSSNSTYQLIDSCLVDTTYIDTSVEENEEYKYKIEGVFENPIDTFFSSIRSIFIDLTPPLLDTVQITKKENGLLINANLMDTSGILWDTLGYKVADTIYLVGEDSTSGNNHFFNIPFTEDTLFYFLKVCDASYIKNYKRYPDTGYYIFGNLSGCKEGLYPDSTYLFSIPQVLCSRGITLRYALSKDCNVSIMLYDITGRKVETVINKRQKRGIHSVPLKMSGKPDGIYFVQMRAGRYKKTVKLVKIMQKE